MAAHRTSCSSEPHGAREPPDITAETCTLRAFFWEKDTSHPSHGLPCVLEEYLLAHVSHHHTTSEPHWAPQSLAHPSSPLLGAYEWRTGRSVLGQEGQVKWTVPDLDMTAGTTLQKMKTRLWEGTTQDRLGVTCLEGGAPGSGKASQEQRQLSWPWRTKKEVTECQAWRQGEEGHPWQWACTCQSPQGRETGGNFTPARGRTSTLSRATPGR